MKTIPTIDNFFNLEEALKDYGFKIDPIDLCLAYDYYYEYYGEIKVLFNQSIVSNEPIDMWVYYTSKELDIVTLFKGVAPTNQHDFGILMQLLFPSDEFRKRFEDKYY